jgi:hypothetical protein
MSESISSRNNVPPFGELLGQRTAVHRDVGRVRIAVRGQVQRGGHDLFAGARRSGDERRAPCARHGPQLIAQRLDGGTLTE